MPRKDLVQEADVLFSQQMLTFMRGIGPYAAELTLTSAQVDGQAADALRFAYELECRYLCRQSAKAWTAWKVISRNGGKGTAASAPLPFVWPTPVPAVAPGIERRFRRLMREVKNRPAYNHGMGKVLGTEAVIHSGPDFETFRPVLKLMLVGGQVLVRWGWQGYGRFLDMLEIEVDRDDGKGFRPLIFSSTPNYRDPEPLPVKAAKWTYRAVYRVGDQRVGEWSAAVSISVAE